MWHLSFSVLDDHLIHRFGLRWLFWFVYRCAAADRSMRNLTSAKKRLEHILFASCFFSDCHDISLGKKPLSFPFLLLKIFFWRVYHNAEIFDNWPMLDSCRGLRLPTYSMSIMFICTCLSLVFGSSAGKSQILSRRNLISLWKVNPATCWCKKTKVFFYELCCRLERLATYPFDFDL